MNSFSVDHLPWDSEFFGFPVSRIDIPKGFAHPDELRDLILKFGGTLTYVFLPVGDDDRETEKPRSALVAMGGKCVDLKVTYRKAIDESALSPECGEVCAALEVTPALEVLAYASGWCSRFVTDERLTRFFRPMYLTWLKKDLERGRVFVRPNANAPEGMATVSVQNGIGKVGLVAVDAKSCGKGIGTALLYDLDRFLISKGVGVCEVVTQGMNIAARHLYEKVGFELQSQVEVWHVWRS